ncbi:hypothetical protein VTK73DRAFT_5756 [Phialemonium thermophilum]|uniref:Uncharacterized protein n=1 Tax=Phialemonium thermophilum TaxID=223376 RepID=A0ABR3V0S0_9PEZI
MWPTGTKVRAGSGTRATPRWVLAVSRSGADSLTVVHLPSQLRALPSFLYRPLAPVSLRLLTWGYLATCCASSSSRSSRLSGRTCCAICHERTIPVENKAAFRNLGRALPPSRASSCSRPPSLSTSAPRPTSTRTPAAGDTCGPDGPETRSPRESGRRPCELPWRQESDGQQEQNTVLVEGRSRVGGASPYL